MPLRQHDIVLAEGRFQIVLTDRRRLFAVIDAPNTALGPFRVAFEIDRGSPRRELELRRGAASEYAVGGIFSGIGHALSGVAHGVEHVAEGTFNDVSKVVTTLARPVFNVVRDVTAAGMHLIAQRLPFLPEKSRKSIEAASRIVMRARLGDLTAKQFIHDVVTAVKAGVQGARALGDALLTGSRLVAHVLDAPFQLAGHIPGIGGVIHALSPFHKYEQVAAAIQHGDFRALGRIVKDDLSLAQGVVSLIPGVGSGISAAISAGEAALEGGGPLEIAVHAAYGAIPIPLGIREVTDAVLDTVLELATHKGDLTDAAVATARDAVPSGLPRDVFDTLVHLVVKRHPPQKAGIALLDHYVQHFSTAGLALPATSADDIATILRSSRLVQPLGRLVEIGDEPVAAPTTALVLR
jgi:hypothetical protein